VSRKLNSREVWKEQNSLRKISRELKKNLKLLART